jgi:hypothetical protein
MMEQNETSADGIEDNNELHLAGNLLSNNLINIWILKMMLLKKPMNDRIF